LEPELPGHKSDQGIETLPALFYHGFPATQPPIQELLIRSRDKVLPTASMRVPLEPELPGHESDKGIKTLPVLFYHGFPATQPPIHELLARSRDKVLPTASTKDVELNFSAEHAADKKVINGLGVLGTQGTRSIVSQAVTLEHVRGLAPTVEHQPAKEMAFIRCPRLPQFFSS
jgi:hypothetical protein